VPTAPIVAPARSARRSQGEQLAVVHPLRAETAAQKDDRIVPPWPDHDIGERLIGRDQAAIASVHRAAAWETTCQLYSSRSAMRLAMRSGSSADANAIIEKSGTSTKAKRCGPRGNVSQPPEDLLP
jgi:hypothetical protein